MLQGYMSGSPMNNQKFENFMSDLKELCQQHKVILAPSEYDTIQVWDDDPEDPNYYFDFDFQDRLNND